MRRARVVSVALEVPTDDEFEPDDRIAYNTDRICDALREAGRWDPDFVTFPEQMLHRRCGFGDGRIERAQSVPGPATDRVGELAAELDTYVWLPMTERDGDQCYNASVLVGRDGDPVGSYRKVRPTVGEMNGGLTPGGAVPVWETEFGRVGAAICFDLMYPEVGVELARGGANLVFFSSHLRGNDRIPHWARDYGYHVVKAFPTTAEVYTPNGNVVARNHGAWDGQEPLSEFEGGAVARYAYADLNADQRTFTRIPTNRRAVEEIQADHPDVVYHDSGTNETFVLESRSEDVTVDELADEYGMITYRDYLDVTGRACVDANEDARLGVEQFPHPNNPLGL